MALSVAAVLSASIQDELGVERSTEAYVLMDPSYTIADLTAFMSTYLTDLDGCTDGQIVRNRVTIIPTLPGGLKSSAASGSRVNQNGSLNFYASGTEKAWALSIPALSNGSTVFSSGKIVLTSADPIGTLIQLFTTAQTLIAFCNAHSEELTALKDAFMSFRKTRKVSRSHSYEV